MLHLPMENRKQFYICGSAFALGAFIIILMSFIPWPFDFSFPGETLFLGKIQLSEIQMNSYIKYVSIFLIIDSLFVICWFIGWVGFGSLIKQANRNIGNLILIIGLIAPILDFMENSFIWGILKFLEAGLPVSPEQFTLYTSVSQLSYLIPFTLGSFTSIYLLKRQLPSILFMIICVGLLIPGIIGIYMPDNFILKIIWFLAFFSTAAFLLISRARKAK